MLTPTVLAGGVLGVVVFVFLAFGEDLVEAVLHRDESRPDGLLERP